MTYVGKLHLSKRQVGLGVALAAIVMLAAWLRFDGLSWQLPFRLHPDEWKYVSGGAGCHMGEWNPKYFRNPPGFSYLNAAWYPLWLKINPPVEIPEWLGIDPLWTRPSDRVDATFLYRPFDLVLGARALSAMLGALTCGAVFLLARRFLSGGWALGASLLAAVSFAHVRESHIAVNDVCMTLVTTLALWFGVRAAQSGKRRDFFIASALAGVSIAVKYNAVAALAAILALRIVGFLRHENRSRYPILLGDLAIGSAFAGLCFLTICPFPLTDPETFWNEISKLDQAASKTWPGQDTSWSGFQLARILWISEGTVALIFALAGIVGSIRKRCWEVFAFPVCYLLLVMGHPLFFMRFSLPILPWVSVFAVMGVSMLARWIHEKSFRNAAAVVLVLICAIEPLAKDLRGNILMKRTDTRIQCLEWFMTKERTRTLIAADQYVFPLVYRSVSEFWAKPFDPRQVSIDRLESKDLARLDTLSEQVKTGLVTISTFAAFPGYIQNTYAERRNSLIEFAGASAPVQSFNPFMGDLRLEAADVEDTYAPITRLWQRTRPGPTIEIFRRNVEL